MIIRASAVITPRSAEKVSETTVENTKRSTGNAETESGTGYALRCILVFVLHTKNSFTIKFS
jgi:hypothetical protein